MFRPPTPRPLSLNGPSGSLEALLEDPGTTPVRAFAVVCHPHPLQGGTMTNKVVHTLARAFQECGLPTLRFNYRGVGRSEGTYAEGLGETDDAVAVAQAGAMRWPGAQVWFAGFSFGGFVAIHASHRTPTARLVAVAPAVTRIMKYETKGPGCPWLLVQGEADEVIPPEEVYEWAGRQSPAPRIVRLAGVSHFFHGHLNELRDAVIAFSRA